MTLSADESSVLPAPGEFPDFLEDTSEVVAERLLGCFLARSVGGERILGRIVEAEAYDQEDPASHSFVGRTERNEVMFGPAGSLYVYLSYGIHHCCNVVTGLDGFGSAVLIRGLEPVSGIEVVEANRGMTGPTATNGPGKLCEALRIDRSLGGHDLRREPLRLLSGGLEPSESVTKTTRIGISKAVERPWRFYITGNPYVSRR